MYDGPMRLTQMKKKVDKRAVEKVLTHLHRKCNMNYQRDCFVIIIIVITFNSIISLAHVSCIVQLRRTQEFRNTSCLQRFQSSSAAAAGNCFLLLFIRRKKTLILPSSDSHPFLIKCIIILYNSYNPCCCL